MKAWPPPLNWASQAPEMALTSANALGAGIPMSRYPWRRGWARATHGADRRRHRGAMRPSPQSADPPGWERALHARRPQRRRIRGRWTRRDRWEIVQRAVGELAGEACQTGRSVALRWRVRQV